jgi:hypothetical protein
MKARPNLRKPLAAAGTTPSAAPVPAGARRGHLSAIDTGQRRREQRKGSYKRVEVFLGVEAAIALRQLMRDGRTAREVIEELLLAQRKRDGRMAQ